jgi:FtsP/CotA-like multicopper oxidase with cupredoxin domain
MVRGVSARSRSTSLINRLGFQRSALVINGQTPGPELRLVQGDTVEVTRPKVYRSVNAHHQV